jgi:hypothetical protein
MGNLVIATPVLSDAASLSAGSQAAAMPVTNLQTIQPGEVWRALDLTQSFVVADLGSAQSINLVSLIATNASAAATWRVRGANSVANLTAAPGYDSGSISHWPNAGLGAWSYTNAYLWLGAAPQNFRYWRIDVADAANPAGFYQAGRLYLASAWQPSRNFAYGWQILFQGDGPKSRSEGGQGYALIGARYRTLDLTLKFASEAEMFQNGFELERLRGTSQDLLILKDPDNAAGLIMQQSLYGTAVEFNPLINTFFKIFEKRFHLEELLP